MALVENRLKKILIPAPTLALFDRFRALIDDLRRLALIITFFGGKHPWDSGRTFFALFSKRKCKFG